jgi:hypothetical protein
MALHPEKYPSNSTTTIKFKNQTTMNKKEKTIYTAAVIEDLLDKSLELTEDPEKSFELIKFSPDDIIFMHDGELRYIAAMIYACLNAIEFNAVKAEFTKNGFEIKFII